MTSSELLRLTPMGDITVPVGRGLLQGCRPHGRGRQAYRDVLTAFHAEDLVGPEIAISPGAYLCKPQSSEVPWNRLPSVSRFSDGKARPARWHHPPGSTFCAFTRRASPGPITMLSPTSGDPESWLSLLGNQHFVNWSACCHKSRKVAWPWSTSRLEAKNRLNPGVRLLS
jgi:hypothetical protein